MKSSHANTERAWWLVLGLGPDFYFLHYDTFSNSPNCYDFLKLEIKIHRSSPDNSSPDNLFET